MLKKTLKWSGIVLGSVLGLLLLIGGVLYYQGSKNIDQVFEIADTRLFIDIPSDSAAVAEGHRLIVSRGCTECHGEDLSGKLMIDSPAMATLAPANLTAGKGGIGREYRARDWVRAIRYGLNRQGRALAIMPAVEYSHINDVQLGAMIAYLKQLPPVGNELPKRRFGVVFHLLNNFNDEFLPGRVIVHDEERSADVSPGITTAYGEYLATMCQGCHGPALAGGIVSGAPGSPPSANITPDPSHGLGNWDEEDFFRALRSYTRPDGSEISKGMPEFVGKMSDDELKALWLYLQSIVPVAQAVDQ